MLLKKTNIFLFLIFAVCITACGSDKERKSSTSPSPLPPPSTAPTAPTPNSGSTTIGNGQRQVEKDRLSLQEPGCSGAFVGSPTNCVFLIDGQGQFTASYGLKSGSCLIYNAAAGGHDLKRFDFRGRIGFNINFKLERGESCELFFKIQSLNNPEVQAEQIFSCKISNIDTVCTV